MFERVTDRGRRTIVLAQENARMLKHNYIGTEHILLGLAQEDVGVAAQALRHLGVTYDEVRDKVIKIIGEGQQSPSGNIPFTPRAKKVLELAMRESLTFGHNYIGTEHLLLGLIREGEGVGANILLDCDVLMSDVRQEIVSILSGSNNPATDLKVARASLAVALSVRLMSVGVEVVNGQLTVFTENTDDHPFIPSKWEGHTVKVVIR